MDRFQFVALVTLCAAGWGLVYGQEQAVIQRAEPTLMGPERSALEGIVESAARAPVAFIAQLDDESQMDGPERIETGEAVEPVPPPTRIAALLKPIGAVEFPDAAPPETTPENRAAEIMELEGGLLITATPLEIRVPQRYPIRFVHRPLYYEERALERCGHGYGLLQPAVSLTGFLSNTMLIPYRMTQRSPHHEVVSPGDCLSGQTMPELEPIWFDTKALAVEAAAAAGFAVLLM